MYQAKLGNYLPKVNKNQRKENSVLSNLSGLYCDPGKHIYPVCWFPHRQLLFVVRKWKA